MFFLFGFDNSMKSGVIQNNINYDILNQIYKNSMRVYRDTITKAKSNTLKDLYTDEFRPSRIKSNITTVKDISTGEPIEVLLDSMLTDGFSSGKSHRIKNYLMTKNKTILGYKTFGFNIEPNKPITYDGGFIRSMHNNEVSGTQIRLLQSAIEASEKKGVNKMTLTSLLPAVKFHTMMGFRPERSFNQEITCVKDIERVMKENAVDFQKSHFSENEVTPVLSKKDGKYYFDRNRTMYCASMKHCENIMKSEHRRNIRLTDENPDESINMIMQGKEFNNWLNRIKGFEILPDGENTPQKGSKIRLIYRCIKEFLRS